MLLVYFALFTLPRLSQIVPLIVVLLAGLYKCSIVITMHYEITNKIRCKHIGELHQMLYIKYLHMYTYIIVS